jgi:two-component system, chemotaxis family, CheB/CheR fusion protein
MTLLINDVLDYSRLTYLEEQFVITDLNQILKTVLSDFDLLISEKRASINCSQLPTAEVIPLQMNQLFHNLISNGLKFSRNGIPPVIEISSRILPAEEVVKQKLNDGLIYCELIFKDNGIGFSQNYAEQIFVIFKRLNARHQFSGTGIGLALCRKIVSIHKGNIFALSTENQGASFHVILPIRLQ